MKKHTCKMCQAVDDLAPSMSYCPRHDYYKPMDDSLRNRLKLCFVNKHQHVRVGNECTCHLGIEETIDAILEVVRGEFTFIIEQMKSWEEWASVRDNTIYDKALDEVRAEMERRIEK